MGHYDSARIRSIPDDGGIDMAKQGAGRWSQPDLAEWEAHGGNYDVGGHRIFAVDAGPDAGERFEPLMVVHGYPTSSFDFSHLLGHLAEHRRVVLVDLLGYGLSDKPDISYTMAGQADVVAGVAEALGLERVALLTHDMGDTVGGELLARQMEGAWPVEITRRVVTNGSIYIAMAQLTAGQQLLLSLPDTVIDEAQAPPAEAIAASLVATLSPTHASVDMDAHAELIVHGGGNRMLARTIRYIEERRANERRFTGAIERHPSPLTIVWGPEDPIAVAAMATRLHETRSDAKLCWVEGAGHYPQIEEPARYLEALDAALTSPLGGT
jgi:pimeloyl-ACP methyl ester carboxylesterase